MFMQVIFKHVKCWLQRISHSLTPQDLHRFVRLILALGDNQLSTSVLERFIPKLLDRFRTDQEWARVGIGDEASYLLPAAVAMLLDLRGQAMEWLSLRLLSESLYFHRPDRRLYFRKIYRLDRDERDTKIIRSKEWLAYRVGRAIGANTAATIITGKGKETFSSFYVDSKQEILPQQLC